MNQGIFFYVILSTFSALIATHGVKYDINGHPSFFGFLPNNTQRIILDPPPEKHFYEQFAILNSQFLVVSAGFSDKEPGTLLSLVDITLGEIVDQLKTNPSTTDITPTENLGFFCISRYRNVSYFQVKNSKLELLGTTGIPQGMATVKVVGYHLNLGLVINNNTSTLYFAPIPSFNQPFELTTCYAPIDSRTLINSDISPNGNFLILSVEYYQQKEVLKVEVVKSETGFTCKKTFSRGLGTYRDGSVLVFKGPGADGKGVLVTEDKNSDMWFEVASIDYNIFEFTDNNHIRFEGHRGVGLVQVRDDTLVIRAWSVIYLDYDYFQFKIDAKSGKFELVSIQSRKNDTYSGGMVSNSDILGLLTRETREVDIYFFD